MKVGLQEVSEAHFFWASSRPVSLGFRVPKARPRETDLEDVFERVRKERAPNATSRLSCVFVCPAYGRGFCTKTDNWLTASGKYVYRVSVTGTAFTTDGGMWTEALFNPLNVEGWANSYWNPQGSVLIDHAEETLVDGTVTVVEALWGSIPEARVASRWRVAADVSSWMDSFGGIPA